MPGLLQEALSDHPTLGSSSMLPRTSGSFFLRPENCRPPQEVQINRRADLQGVLGLLHWQVSVLKAVVPTPPHAQSSASAVPPNHHSNESSFSMASLLPPYSWEQENVNHTFLARGKCVLTREPRNYQWGFLNCAALVCIYIWGVGVCPGEYASPPDSNTARNEKP